MKKQNFKNETLNMKGSKGITLIALIITIIVLLILAVVAISSVNNTGIVQYAQNSKVAYIDGRDEEDTTLQNYMDIINHHDPKEEKTEFYGSTYYGIEFITETTGKFYIPGINDNGYLDVTFSGNKIMYEGESMGEYSIYTLENNKILSMDDYEFFPTNGVVGLDNSLLDGKIYIRDNTHRMEFENGIAQWFKGGDVVDSQYNYYILNSYVLNYNEEVGTFLESGSLSDSSTLIINGVTYTLQQ